MSRRSQAILRSGTILTSPLSTELAGKRSRRTSEPNPWLATSRVGDPSRALLESARNRSGKAVKFLGPHLQGGHSQLCCVASESRRDSPTVGKKLSTQVQQFVQQLLAGRDHPAVATVLGAGQDQFDQVAADVGVAQFQSTADHAADPAFAGSSLNGQARC